MRQLIGRLGGGRGHRTFAGTPEQVADPIEEWFTQRRRRRLQHHAARPALGPGGLRRPRRPDPAAARPVPPEYAGTTLRDHYGLPVPGCARPTWRRWADGAPAAAPERVPDARRAPRGGVAAPGERPRADAEVALLPGRWPGSPSAAGSTRCSSPTAPCWATRHAGRLAAAGPDGPAHRDGVVTERIGLIATAAYDLRRALQPGPPVRLAGPGQPGPGGVEHGHHLGAWRPRPTSVRRSRCPATRTRYAARRGVPRRGARPLGRLGPRRDRSRTRGRASTPTRSGSARSATAASTST